MHPSHCTTVLDLSDSHLQASKNLTRANWVGLLGPTEAVSGSACQIHVPAFLQGKLKGSFRNPNCHPDSLPIPGALLPPPKIRSCFSFTIFCAAPSKSVSQTFHQQPFVCLDSRIQRQGPPTLPCSKAWSAEEKWLHRKDGGTCL